MKESNGDFWHWWISTLAGYTSVAEHSKYPKFRFASFQPLRSPKSPSTLILVLHSCPTTIFYSNYCLLFHLHHPPNVIIPGTTSHDQTARILILFGGNFYEQQVVLSRLSNTVKWSTFSVSFIHLLTILGWLVCFKTFKIDYLVISNLRFGSFPNPVTYCFYGIRIGGYKLYRSSWLSNLMLKISKRSSRRVPGTPLLMSLNWMRFLYGHSSTITLWMI